MRGSLKVALFPLMDIPLMDSNVKHYFTILLVICPLYFENSVHFIGLFPDLDFYFFNIYFYDFSLCILYMNHPSDKQLSGLSNILCTIFSFLS